MGTLDIAKKHSVSIFTDEDGNEILNFELHELEAFRAEIEKLHEEKLVDSEPVAGYFLPMQRLNEPMLNTIKLLIDHSRRGRWTNAIVRQDGKETTYEADWIKSLVEIPQPPVDVAELRAKLNTALDALDERDDKELRLHNRIAKLELEVAKAREEGRKEAVPDCNSCANRGKVYKLSEESYCSHCKWQEKWRKDLFVAAPEVKHDFKPASRWSEVKHDK